MKLREGLVDPLARPPSGAAAALGGLICRFRLHRWRPYVLAPEDGLGEGLAVFCVRCGTPSGARRLDVFPRADPDLRKIADVVWPLDFP